jgi:uncharacterized heparinase superfamily protein
MTMSEFGRYWHTLRHLRPVQFYRRVWFRLYRPRINASAIAQPRRVPKGDWQRPAARTASMLGPMQFRFLNQTQTLPEQGGWNDAGIEKLWLYNLHYFDDLNASEAEGRIEWHQGLIVRWLKENPHATGNGWEPYPTSLRIVNWVKWLAGGNAAVPGMLESLSLQAGWLTKRLESHLLGNHFFANAKALVFAGLFFEGPEAAAWLRKGLKIIKDELPEQVLADGGNFERSPMYHAIFLEDMLDLLNMAGVYSDQVPKTLVVQWRGAALRMLDWLNGMTHPDGQIALFNDAAFGIAAAADDLAAYAERVLAKDAALSGLPRRYASSSHRGDLNLSQWVDSGYIRLECADAAAILDVAPIGPNYLPGHAHADTLSFELSVFGQRVIVNGGTSRYGWGPERLFERQTVNHSTVEIDGQSSSEVWGGFRVARRAYPFNLEVSQGADFLSVACSHDGYKRLPGKPVHRRSWQFSSSHLDVADSVLGGCLPAVSRYILHPDVKVERVAADSFQLRLADGRLIFLMISKGTGRLERACYAPEFGKVLPTQSIAVDLQDGKAQVRWSWS